MHPVYAYMPLEILELALYVPVHENLGMDI